MKAKALLDGQADTIRKLKAKTSTDTLGNKEFKTLVDMLGKRQTVVKAKTVGDTLGNVKSEHCSTCQVSASVSSGD